MNTMVLHRRSRWLQPPATPAGVRAAEAARMPMPAPVVDSRVLLGGQREVLIEHGGEVYRLRHTRNDRLILTK